MGDLRRRENKCYQNSPGILDGAIYEAACSTRCGPGENHTIVIPKLAFTFSVPPRHSDGTFSAVWP